VFDAFVLYRIAIVLVSSGSALCSHSRSYFDLCRLTTVIQKFYSITGTGSKRGIYQINI